MMLWCFDDPKGWGQQLRDRAIELDYEAGLFRTPRGTMHKGDYVFMRIPQEKAERSVAKALAKYLQSKGMILIPDYFTCRSYEDKEMQTQAYAGWMPTTYVLHSRHNTWHDAERAIEDIGLPFISKSREGSSSINVRLVKTIDEAKVEWSLAMKGQGIAMPTGKQLDYLIWQKFCSRNAGDLRVCINGKHLLMLERDNAHGSPFASGSGKNRPVNKPNEFQTGALIKARQFFNAFDLKWNGIDLVFDYDDDEWKVLETTLGWSLPAYDDCVYYGTKYRGRDIWELLLEQIEKGVFG